MVPFKQNGTAFYVAVNDPVNLLSPLDDLRLLLGGPVVPVLCRNDDIQNVIDGYFEQQGENARDMIDTIVHRGTDEDDESDRSIRWIRARPARSCQRSADHQAHQPIDHPAP